MTDPTVWPTGAAALLIGFVIITQWVLKGWREWLDLKRLEMERQGAGAAPRFLPLRASSSPTSRNGCASLRQSPRAWACDIMVSPSLAGGFCRPSPSVTRRP